MKLGHAIASIFIASTLAVTSGCAVIRGQESAGAYIDDAAITTAVKAKMVESKAVDAGAITVETLNGTVLLSGFAKNSTEKSAAENIARESKGVKSVRNNIAVRP